MKPTPGVFWQKSMKSRLCDPSYLLTYLELYSGLYQKAHCSRRDDIHELVLDDQDDSEQVCSDDCHGVFAHLSWFIFYQHLVKRDNTFQCLCILCRNHIVIPQFTNRSVDCAFEQQFFLRLRH